MIIRNRLGYQLPCLAVWSVVAMCLIAACGQSESAPIASVSPIPVDTPPPAPFASAVSSIPTPTPSPMPPAPVAELIPTLTPTALPTPMPVSTIPPPALPIASPVSQPPDADLNELAERLRGAVIDDNPPGSAPALSVGYEEEFWITDLDDGSAHMITARLHIVSDNAYWFVDEAVSVDASRLEASAEIYETVVRPAVTGAFGDIRNPGIDGDPRLFILHTRLDGAAGYFGSADPFMSSVHPHSNQREIIYMDVDTEYLPVGSEAYMGVIAHELQHAVHDAVDEGEDSWVNEGLSELAAHVAGYELDSPHAFLERPHTQLNYWAEEYRRRYAHYGASALFFVYLAQRIGGAQDMASLVAEPLDGIAGVDEFLKRYGLTFYEVFADWVVANYMDSDDDRYGYAEYDTNILAIRALTGGRVRSDTLSQFSSRYYSVAPNAEGGKVEFDGDTQTPQFGAECLSAQGCWWSGRGDAIDTKLTREFDLSDTDSATLSYMVWHDIEEGWDYGYVEASGDGGRTWHVLEGEYTRDDDVSGNAYGPGYTGSSLEWKRETVDLTPFAGGSVLVRFEYVTDAAIYLDGVLIDDISIPESGFSSRDDADVGEWDAEGFTLAGDPLEQRFIVQVIHIDDAGDFTVSRLDLDDQNAGSLQIEPDGRAIVVVSPISEGTRHPASYSLELVPGE